MANKIFKVALLFAAAISIFNACNDELSPMELSNGYDSNSGKKIVKVDHRVDITYTDARQRFVENGIENSLVLVDIFAENGELPRDRRISFVVPTTHVGDEPQYLQPKSFVYTTSRGEAVVVLGSEVDGDSYKMSPIDSTNVWNAVNDEAESFKHHTTTGSASSVFVYYDEELDKTLVVEFPAPTWEVEEKTLPNVGVNGVMYEGKSWNAEKYSSEVVATFTIAEAFRTAGEAYVKDFTVTNIAFLLKHEVETKVENVEYGASFVEDGSSVKTDYQYDGFNLVTRDNGEVTNTENYHLDMNLFANLTAIENVEVYSEAALLDTKVSNNQLNFGKPTTTAEGIFTKNVYSASDVDTMSDTRNATFTLGYENYLWGSYAFPYAYIKSRKAEVKAELNANESTAFVKYADVTLTETVTIGFIGVNRADETKSASVSYKRFYNVPDDYTYDYKAQEYVGEFKASGASFETSDQHNAYVRKTYNNGVLESEDTFELPLVLSAVVTRTSEAQIAIDKVEDLTVTMTPAGAEKVSYGKADENGYCAQRRTRNYNIRLSDGARYSLEVITENTVKDGKDQFDYAWFDAISPEISLQPKLNEGASTAANPVYDVTVAVNLNVARTTRGQVQTKAAVDEKEPYSIAASHQEVMTIPDDVISTREEKEVTPNGDGFDLVARFFTTYRLSGEKLDKELTGRLNFNIAGVNGEELVVSNVNFSTNGNGFNGTGNGVYTDNASNGNENFDNTYNYSADKSQSFSYDGRTVTFNASFEIVENGHTIGGSTIANGYDVYPYSNAVKGIYTVDGQSIEKVATASRSLKVKRNIPKIIPEEWGNLIGVEVSAVPAKPYGNTYADGPQGRDSYKCFLFKTDKGAFPVVVPLNNDTPTTAQILAANFTTGDFSNANFNSAYDPNANGKWKPACAQDNSGSLQWFSDSAKTKSVRNIRNETLTQKEWGWNLKGSTVNKAGYSTEAGRIQGYAYTCDAEGNLTITKGGNVVLEIR